jgi:DnaJ like chaperone protein
LRGVCPVFVLIFIGLYKWILGIGGLLLTRKIAVGILGYIIGSLIDAYQRSGTNNSENSNRAHIDPFEYYRQQSSRYDIQTMLMALSASVMNADGKVLKVELDYVKSFFQAQFGDRFTKEHLQILKHFLSSGQIPLNEICTDIRSRMPIEVRIQLIHYLFGIAKSDGDVSTQELNAIHRTANMLGISAVDFESVKNMFYRNVDSDYKILGVDSNASDEEVKKAYRKMAIAYHPDKVTQMGEEYQKGAKEKFQKIQDAYEAIKKRRGFK